MIGNWATVFKVFGRDSPFFTNYDLAIRQHTGMKVELIGESYGISPSGLGSQLVGKDADLIRGFESRKKSLETPSLASSVRAGCAFHPEIPHRV